MAIVQCPQGHYYDDQRDMQCPYCGKDLRRSWQNAESFNEQITQYAVLPPQEYDEQQTEAYGEYVGDADLTLGRYSVANGNRLTAGWLVCTQGFARGKSYVLYSGRNFAGRSHEMDLVVSDEFKIARQKHFSVVYDPKSVSFFLIPEGGAIMLNGNIVTKAEELHEGDRIVAGDAEFLFVPFCKEGCTWE